MTELRKRFRALIAAPETLVMPGAYDALSARIIEAEGFDAIAAGGYAALGSMLAEPDLGQSNMRDMADHYARICGAVDIPVSVDGDTGFGGVHNVRQTIRAFEAAGAAGLFISDQVFPNRCGYLPGKQVIPIEEMLAKLKSALDARRDESFVIGARTDAASVLGPDAAIERACLFVEAGADVVKPQTMDRREEIERILREVPAPFLATLSQAAGRHPLDIADFRALGVPAVSLPSTLLFAAVAALRDVAQRIRATGSIGAVQNDLVTLGDYYGLVRLPEIGRREEAFARVARDLVEGSVAPAPASAGGGR